ncbi:uncharacterized protein LOC144915298 isoform X2 [Branchiostoma floridae x Branchiostoma belcheri]
MMKKGKKKAPSKGKKKAGPLVTEEEFLFAQQELNTLQTSNIESEFGYQDDEAPDLAFQAAPRISRVSSMAPQRKSMAPQKQSNAAPPLRKIQVPQPPPLDDFQNVSNIDAFRSRSASPAVSEPADPVDLSWPELFTELDVKTYYPLEAFKAKIQDADAQLGRLDFTGIDQLSDSAFRVLYSALCQFSGKLQAVDCGGCTHLTDAGVYWLARCGQVGGGLQEVILKGCRQVTEASILHLLEHNPGLSLLDMSFTSVSSLSVFMEKKCQPGGRLQVDFTGCPLVTPPASQAKSLESFEDILSFFEGSSNKKGAQKALHTRNSDPRVVLVGDHTPATAQLLVSLLPKVSKLSSPPLPGQIEVYQDCVLQQGGTKRSFDIVYCTPEELNSSLFVTEGTVFVVLSNGKNTCTRGADIIKGIRAKVPKAPCLLAELSGEDQTSTLDMTSAVELVQGAVHTMEESIAGMDFNSQANFAKSCQQMVDMKQAIKVISVGESRGVDTLLAEIQNIMETSDSLWPQYKGQSPEFHEFLKHLKSVAVQKQILPLETLVKELPKKWLGDGTLVYGKALEALHNMGKVFYLPMLKDQPVILDVKWFIQTMKELSSSKLLAPLGHNLDGFSPDMPVIPKSALSSLWHLTENKLPLMSRVLTELGISISPYNPPGTSADASNGALITYANIPATPAVPLDEFWPEKVSPDDLEMRQHYHILPAPPPGLMASLLSEFSQLGGFSLVWREGVILRRGAVEVLIQIEKKDVKACIPVMEAEKELDLDKPKAVAVTTEEDAQKYVLLSFAPKDLRRVQNISTELSSKGYLVTMDGNKSVMDTVSMAAVVLMCITNDYKETGRCKRVVQQAAELGVPLIPIKLQTEVVMDDWLQVASNKVLINMTPTQDWGWAVQTLKSELGSLGKRVTKPRNFVQPRKRLKDTQELGGPYLTVAARTFKPEPGMNVSWVQQIYHSCLTVVEYVLRTQGLSAVVTIPCPTCVAKEKQTVHEFQRDVLTPVKQVACPNCGLQKTADILHGDYVPLFLSSHMWPSKPSEVPRVPGVIEGNKDLCVHCGLTREVAAKLWQMQSLITPTFGHECQLYPTRRPGQQLSEKEKHGSLFHPEGKMEVISAQPLDPEGFRDFEVIPAEGNNLYLKFGVRSAKGQVSMTIKGSEVIIATPDSPNGMTHQVDSPAAIYGVKVENADQFDPSEESPQADIPDEPAQETLYDDWQETMRLESKDKKNPTMICVSTVMKVQPPSEENKKCQVLIHFDGWTSRYDYWTDIDDPDLHPLGYCKASGIRLEKPKGYGKQFDWEQYLQEENVDPVPFHVFNEMQKKDSKPYLYDPDAGLVTFDSEEEQQKAMGRFLASNSQQTRKCKVILTRNGQTLTSVVTEGDIRVLLSFSASGESSGQWLNKEPQLILASQTMHPGGSAASVQHMFSSAPFQVGMRLEADDPLGSREAKNSLVCVANIKEMETEADGRQKVEVHFDGWTNKYNYWCYTDDPKLHPIGYCAFKGINLQKPKGHSGTFEWSKYLDDIDKEAVSYQRFNRDQTKGCPPYGMGAAGKLGSKANATSSRVIACRDYGRLVPQTSDVCKFVEAYQSKILSPRLLPENPTFAVLLPEQLDLPLLLYPSRRAVQGGRGQALHVLCPGELQYQNIHLVGTANAVTLGQQSDKVQGMLSKLLLFCHSLITCRKVFLPPDLAALVKEDVTEDLVVRALARLLSMYASASLLLSYLNGYDIAQIAANMDKWLPQEMSVIKDTVLPGKSVSGTNGQWLCPGHQSSWHVNDNSLQTFPLQEFASYAGTISTLTFEANGIQSLPDNFFAEFWSLRQANLSSNQLQSLPLGIGSCENLESFSVNYNSIANLPSDFHDCGKSLLVLKISGNPMDSLPSPLASFGRLEELQASSMQLRQLPDDIKGLQKLKTLNLSSNPLTDLPASFCELKSLTHLDISGVPWIEQEQGKATLLSYEAFLNFTRRHGIFSTVSEKDLRDVFTSCDNDKNGLLDEGEVPKLNAQLFIMFPRFGTDSTTADDDLGGIPGQVFALESLEELHMRYQALRRVPAEVKQLKKLKQLSLQHNPKLETLAAELGGLQLKGMQISNCPTLRTPPREIVARGFSAVMAYLSRLLSGSVECKRTKLMFVGLGGAGKTSLMRALMSGNYVTPATVGEAITDGIDIKTWEIKQGRSKLSFSVWDFAGQTVYYNTHQFFLSNRAVYMLIWNTRLGHEHAGLDFWLSSIECHAPKAPIFVIGTHADQVTKSELPMEELSRRYQQIKGYFCVSSHTGQGVKELHDKLISVTLDEPYMGERIPQVWLSFEQSVIKDRKQQSVLPWEVVAKHASGAGIFDRSELNQAVQFLHDLGTLQHFDNEYLKDRVVINPQWIVDVMACVVSVHTTAIKEGRFDHKDVSLVWKDYPVDLHNWLLRLTEEFDLTFPLPDQPVNVVPCLLPDKEAQYEWPEVEPPCHETKMLYRFDYLPAGLFNRAQVRLCQYSDSSAVWKRGSLLRKNKHLALIQQTKGSELLVKVQGPRPENILFLVHEVFEALIAESFHGVQYDFLIPCPDCIKVGSLDPYMFAASLVRKAVELKAPFLQCGTYFHIVSITELQAIMPPTSGTDFHMHLENAVRDLQNLHVTLSTDVFITFCQDNVPKDYNDPRAVHPARIRDDIQAAGYTCWYQEDQNDLDVQDLAVAMKDAQVTVVLMSDEYEGSESCRAIIHYVRSTLRKPVILIVVGKGWNWQKTDTGLLLAHMLYINMQDPKLYKDKIAEVLSQLEMKTTKKQTQQFPPCFISYCWANSEEACNMGQVTRYAGAVGRVDPRQLKSHLEQKDVKCWMDIERVGKGGLFEDIAEGLRHAKMVVACVSDEYVRSKNCQMEFRFAAVTLRLPIVLAVVGTGYQWESTECGMLSLGFNKINFQHGGEVEMDRLVELVQEKCKTEDEATNDSADDDKSSNSASFQELYELAQRKFLRQVAHYEELLDLPPYPRLVVVDFHHQEEQKEESEEGKGKDADNEKKEEEKEAEKKDDDMEVSENRPASVMERPRTAGIRTMAKDMTPVTPTFCFRVLCEHEQGWHLCSTAGVPVPGSQAELQSKLKAWSPYLARLYAILKHGPVQLDVLTEQEKGDQFLQFLEEHVGSSLDFNQPYGELIKAAMAADTEGTAGGLARCHLPNGKTVWLCEQHRHNGRLTILDSEVAVPAAGGGEQSQVDADMLEQLQNLSINDVPTPQKQPQKQQTAAGKGTVTNQEPKIQNSVEEGAKAEAEAPRRPKTAKEKFRSAVNAISATNTQSKACSLM